MDALNSVPRTDAEARDHIRALGFDADKTDVMVGIFDCYREGGQPLLDAFKHVLIRSLPNDTLERLSDIPDVAEVLAERGVS